MARKAGIKAASEATGLSEWELRMGARAGKYPHIRIGESEHGKLIFDLDILEEFIKGRMLQNVKLQTNEEPFQYGQLRQVKA